MSLIAESKTPSVPTCPRVLVVDDEQNVTDLIKDVFTRELDCQLLIAANASEAKHILATQVIELMVTDISLPDGDGIALVKALRSHQPMAEAIVMTGAPSVDWAVDAMRGGAVDFVSKPFTAPALLERVRRALFRQATLAKSEARIERLKGAVKRLNEARRLVTKKVDLLCNDLVGAYGELSRQLDYVRTEENFRKVLSEAHDLEQMLCHAMDWLLREMGYANVAIWLASEEQYQLGAYMKYSIAGDAALAEAMRNGLLRKLERENFIHLEAPQTRKALSSAEARILNDQTVLAVRCTYLGESLAAIILFREGSKPFSDEEAKVLESIAPIFATALAAAVRDDSTDDTSSDSLQDPFEDEQHPPKPKKKDKKKDTSSDADWWKNGGPSPF